MFDMFILSYIDDSLGFFYVSVGGLLVYLYQLVIFKKVIGDFLFFFFFASESEIFLEFWSFFG